jgi:hypothetical protein
MNRRRLTRSTNGSYKAVERHACAVALHFVHCNSTCILSTLRLSRPWPPVPRAGFVAYIHLATIRRTRRRFAGNRLSRGANRPNRL